MHYLAQQTVRATARAVRAPVLRALLLLCGLVALAAPAQAHLLDEFTRSDADALGNQWIEKNSAAFALAGGAVTKLPVGTGYRDNIVYRPSSEDVLNAEASLEISFTTLPPGYPQVLVRVQSATAATADVFDSYILYLSDSTTEAVLGRQNGNTFVTTLAVLALTQQVNATDRFRMRLSATGTSPVVVSGYVERLSGVVWQVIGQAVVSDSSAQRIATAGSVGFGGYVETSYRLDNFVRVNLGATGTSNPAPSTAAISPTTAVAGTSGQLLRVYGSGFTTDSIGRWNGSDRATTYVSPSELQVQLTGSDLAAPSTAQVTVLNPAPGGGVSAAQPFQVTALAAPTLTQLSPSSALAGDPGFTLTVTGTAFDSTSLVLWNGVSRATTFVSAAQLTATIPPSDIASSGAATVVVRRQSDGVNSAGLSFTITPPAATPDFVDAFTRADNATIGNGWLEKTASAFSIAGNEAAKVAAGASDYRNNVVYRPAGEDLLDVEAAVELRFASLPTGYPQLMVRALSSTVATTSVLDAYLLYVNDSATQALLSRQRGGNWDTPLGTLTISPPLNTTDRYRMRLRATGTNPVQLTAYIERLVGSTWQVSGQASYSDSTAARVASAGSVGFGGYVETSYRYDNFTRANVSTPNPVPATSGLSPSSAPAGSNAINLTVNGTGFASGSVVRWNGSDRVTTFVSETQLTALIPIADLAAQGSATVVVFNPAPGGGTSNVRTFSITAPSNNPVPAATALAPSSAAAGSSGFTLTVTGSSFAPSSTVRWNGSARTTTYASSTSLTAAINAADVASAGSATVTVFTPTPGGGTSAGLNFTITATNPVPTASALSPSSAAAGAAGFNLSVLGTGFVAGSVVRWNGADRPTTLISATEVRAVIAAADVSSAGTRTVTVFTPTPGGGTSNGQTFTVTSGSSNPTPILTQLSPGARPPGSAGFTLTVTGSQFTNQSAVYWDGAPRTTTFISSTELRGQITSADIAVAGLPTVTVVTPSPGGGTSVPRPFFVQGASLEYFLDGFDRADSATVGPGWTEKNPNAFSLAGGEIVSIRTNEDFMNSVVYRPIAEDRLNVEMAVELRRLPNTPILNDGNWPQVHARVQRDTVALANTLSSYIFFIEDISESPRAIFAISSGQNPGFRYECYIAAMPLPQALITGERYRLRLRVTGTNPVQLWGSVEQLTNGRWWTTMASQTVAHSASTQPVPGLFCDQPTMPAPIVTAGSVAFSKWWNRTDNYDNFFWRDVDGALLPPVLSSMNPSSVAAGAPNTTVTVTGARFNTGSIARWNGANRTTTYLSSTQLQVLLTSADLAQAGSGNVTVFDPANSLLSNALAMTISPGSPVQTLADDFTRADSATIGNGWVEKAGGTFSLASGRVLKNATPGGDYRNNLVYRPSGEASLNTEASMELRPTAAPIGWPMLFVRLQSATVANNGEFDGYVLYMNNSASQATLSRQRNYNDWDTPLASFGLTQPVQTGGVYRMRLQAIGSQPVRLTAAIEQLNGSTWETIGQAAFDDSSGDRIGTAGVVGFGGDVENAYTFDAFRRTDFAP